MQSVCWALPRHDMSHLTSEDTEVIVQHFMSTDFTDVKIGGVPL